MKNNKKILKRAFTLTEVLIVLGLISTTMSIALSLIVNSLTTIVENETDELASGIMFEGMEITKTPNTLQVSELPVQLKNNYSIQVDSSTEETYLRHETGELSSEEECTQNSAFYLNSALFTESNINICLQITMNPDGNGDYDVTSKILYTNGSDPRFNLIRGKRYGSNFEDV